MNRKLELHLITAGGKIRCKRCTALSSRSKLQCARPALKNSRTSKCDFHGGRSIGPKTTEGKARIKAAHLMHGNSTLGAKNERAASNRRLRYLVDLGNHAGLFIENVVLLGRPPANYEKLDLNNPEELKKAIKRSQ